MLKTSRKPVKACSRHEQEFLRGRYAKTQKGLKMCYMGCKNENWQGECKHGGHTLCPHETPDEILEDAEDDKTERGHEAIRANNEWENCL